jgi:hypothetical protein
VPRDAARGTQGVERRVRRGVGERTARCEIDIDDVGDAPRVGGRILRLNRIDDRHRLVAPRVVFEATGRGPNL